MWAKVVAGPAAALLCAAGAAACYAASSPCEGSPGRLPVVEAAAKERGRKVSLAGKWQNDLGSEMVLQPPDATGFFRGTYLTKVSVAEKPIRISPLLGLQNVAAGEEAEQQPTFGFTVGWTFSDSTTVFVGQHFVDAAGEETLETSWLLREKADSSEKDWSATRVGRNVFKRIQ